MDDRLAEDRDEDRLDRVEVEDRGRLRLRLDYPLPSPLIRLCFPLSFPLSRSPLYPLFLPSWLSSLISSSTPTTANYGRPGRLLRCDALRESEA